MTSQPRNAGIGATKVAAEEGQIVNTVEGIAAALRDANMRCETLVVNDDGVDRSRCGKWAGDSLWLLLYVDGISISTAWTGRPHAEGHLSSGR